MKFKLRTMIVVVVMAALAVWMGRLLIVSNQRLARLESFVMEAQIHEVSTSRTSLVREARRSAVARIQRELREQIASGSTSAIELNRALLKAEKESLRDSEQISEREARRTAYYNGMVEKYTYYSRRPWLSLTLDDSQIGL